MKYRKYESILIVNISPQMLANIQSATRRSLLSYER